VNETPEISTNPAPVKINVTPVYFKTVIAN